MHDARGARHLADVNEFPITLFALKHCKVNYFSPHHQMFHLFEVEIKVPSHESSGLDGPDRFMRWGVLYNYCFCWLLNSYLQGFPAKSDYVDLPLDYLKHNIFTKADLLHETDTGKRVNRCDLSRRQILNRDLRFLYL